MVSIPEHSGGVPGYGETLFDLNDVTIGGSKILSTPSEAHAQVIAAYLMTRRGFVGDVHVLADQERSSQAYVTWHRAWQLWQSAVAEFLMSVFPRPQQAQRRVQVAREIEQQAKLARGALDHLAI
jgi:hypothetical protein